MGTDTGATPAGFEAVRAVADAILYEGYLLYPYRRSSGKNRIRWQFGVLLPPAWARAHGLTGAGVAGAAESWRQRTECLLEAPDDATVHIRMRFLQLRRRRVQEPAGDGAWRTVDSLEAGPRLELSFEDAVPREFDVRATVAGLLAGELRTEIIATGGESAEPLTGGTDDPSAPVGRVLTDRSPVRASLIVSAERCRTPYRLLRLRVRIENEDRATPPGAPREEALRASLLACHTLLAAPGGRFLSLLDPPHWAEEAARDCANAGTFPVLAGAPGSGDTVLSSPIILYDHPRVAPESPGDLHDATEIDEILSLRTLTLTEDEKREARATDPRAAAILDRVDGMPPHVLAGLHGAVRSKRPASGRHGETDGEVWDSRDTGNTRNIRGTGDAVLVEGVRVAKGSRVRLRPRTAGTDPQDRFLDGRIGVVEAVLTDVDDSRHLAVTVEDDPAADLNRWYGRFRYFSPEEVEPVEPAP